MTIKFQLGICHELALSFYLKVALVTNGKKRKIKNINSPVSSQKTMLITPIKAVGFNQE
ncbi:hypothetical protein [Acinetobacter puyangensis]|uniref:hypothetical protein n=1 Tax=Acinetobacter puyangensis TaxID=1096779 RepID=UPI00148DE02C|nr:hypothetical protein [Acinetobacter puyangensis]